MKYRISEDVLSQMIFYHVLQCLRKHCVPEEHLDECVVDVSTFNEGEIALKSEFGESFVQGAMIYTKNDGKEHEPPLIAILRSTHTIQIAFPKLMPKVTMAIRITNGVVSVDSSGKDPLSDEMLEALTYFGDAVSKCLLNILPQGSTIYYKKDLYQRLRSMMEKLDELIANLPDDEDDEDEDDNDEMEET